ncbi:MAG: sulfotransferase family 2 domain-containing protein [Puniceicoccaceae bacterium]
MILSHKKKFIFIHIFKTAGTSVSQVLLPYARMVDRAAFEFRITRSLFGRISGVFGWQDLGMEKFTGFKKHEVAYKLQEKLPQDIFENYYKFCFVRDPFDHLVSIYHYIGQSPSHKYHAKASALNFGEFVKWYVSQKPLRQCDFILNKEGTESLVDFFGKYENLDEDMRTIAKRLELSYGSIPFANRSVNRTKTATIDYYDDCSAREVVSYFEKDFEVLGYKKELS